MSKKNKTKFIFLDRDGVINEDLLDYVITPKTFKFIDGSIEAIKQLTDDGYKIIIVTNQACIGKGLASHKQIDEVNKYMVSEINKKGGEISEIFVCPHKQDEGCKCRKPEIGLLLQAEAEIGQSLKKIFFIGDKESDLNAAKSHKCIPILVKTGYGEETLRHLRNLDNLLCFKNLISAVKYVLEK